MDGNNTDALHLNTADTILLHSTRLECTFY